MIDQTAIIEDGAKIASDVKIGPFCCIGKNVTISKGCELKSNIILAGKLTIEEDVKIFSSTVIGSEISDIIIGEKTYIREHVQIGNHEDENGESKPVSIGKHNFIMGDVQIGSGVKIGDWSIVTNSVVIFNNIECEERVIVGGLSTIASNNKIGTGVMIGGGSYVEQDMPPFTLVEGNKATIKGLNSIGLQRRLSNKEVRKEIKKIFKKVIGKDTNKKLAQEIYESHANEYVKRFALFVANSNMQ